VAGHGTLYNNNTKGRGIRRLTWRLFEPSVKTKNKSSYLLKENWIDLIEETGEELGGKRNFWNFLKKTKNKKQKKNKNF
jgi:tRNA U38,U39,U40 pseudouridine synthase TruA